MHLSLRNTELQPRGALEESDQSERDVPGEAMGNELGGRRPYLLVAMDTIAASLLYQLPSLSWTQMNEQCSAPVPM